MLTKKVKINNARSLGIACIK